MQPAPPASPPKALSAFLSRGAMPRGDCGWGDNQVSAAIREVNARSLAGRNCIREHRWGCNERKSPGSRAGDHAVPGTGAEAGRPSLCTELRHSPYISSPQFGRERCKYPLKLRSLPCQHEGQQGRQGPLEMLMRASPDECRSNLQVCPGLFRPQRLSCLHFLLSSLDGEINTFFFKSNNRVLLKLGKAEPGRLKI